jgi:arylsulfatase A-like enzyme
MLAGGALAGGRVVGDPGPDGMSCEAAVSIKDFFATIYKAGGVDPETEYSFEGIPFKYIDGGKPVKEFF